MTISAVTAAVGGTAARGVTEEEEEERVLLLPARLGVLEGAGVLLGGGVLEGYIQVEEEVWRHLLSWGERMVLGRMVTCNMPPRSWVGVPMREESQSVQCMCEPRGTGTRGVEGHSLGRWTQDPSTARVASSERVPWTSALMCMRMLERQEEPQRLHERGGCISMVPVMRSCRSSGNKATFIRCWKVPLVLRGWDQRCWRLGGGKGVSSMTFERSERGCLALR
jgi:hypothetical protein